MLKIFFLKKKRFYNLKKQIRLFHDYKTGAILFFEYISLDRDLFFKYKLHGLCVGFKKNFLMTICYLNTVLCGNQINFVFFFHSPFIFNIKLLGFLKYHTSKIFKIVPKLRIIKQLNDY